MVFRLTITAKVTILICVVTLLVTGVGVFLGYQWASALLLDTVEENQLNVSALTLRYLSELFDKKVRSLEGYIMSPEWISAVKTANIRYDAGEGKDIQETLLILDKRWRQAGKDEELVKERIRRGKKIGLMALMGAENDIGEIFLTDKYGGVVACSEKTSDFYQADEAWWQKVFNEGRGDIFVGDVAFDESAGLWSITFALPILDEAGQTIGLCKAIVDLKRFFSPLNIFRVSRSGEFTLVNKEGIIIYHYGVEPFTTAFCSDADFRKIAQSPHKRGIVFSPVLDRKVFLVVTDLDYPFLLERGIDLKILISQDAAEVLRPLRALLNQRFKVSAVLLVLMIILGFIAGHALTGPIKKLHQASLRVSRGEYEVKTKIKSNDELGELSSVFDDMVNSIKENQEKLREQTRRLQEAQKQTLDALEEAQEKQKQIETYSQKLAHSNRELEQFAHVVSHDLQEPLRMIASYLQLLEKRYKGALDKDADEFIAYAVDGAHRMSVLINDLLSYSRIRFAAIELKPVECDEILDNALLNLKVSIEESKAAVTHDALPAVFFDKTQLGQLFQNLLSNALKYRKKDSPRIHIAVQKEKKEWVFSVRDNGIGIAAKDFQRIFQPFQRVDIGGFRPGSGIGLAVCERIVERHGGKIWVESEQGKGSVFHFTIPCSQESAS